MTLTAEHRAMITNSNQGPNTVYKCIQFVFYSYFAVMLAANNALDLHIERMEMRRAMRPGELQFVKLKNSNHFLT